MKRLFHLLGQAALLIVMWGVILEIGLRMQQYFGPLYDLEFAGILTAQKFGHVSGATELAGRRRTSPPITERRRKSAECRAHHCRRVGVGEILHFAPRVRI